jgi:hypothetical protein
MAGCSPVIDFNRDANAAGWFLAAFAGLHDPVRVASNGRA